jgi:hypothetical protein
MRRGKNEGSIRERKDGRFEVRVTAGIDFETGKAKRISSQAPLLVLLGDIPISQYLNRVADIDFSSLQEFTKRYGYGNTFSVKIRDKVIKVLPLAHPRQIGALGTHNEKWYLLHKKWEMDRLNEK